MNTKKTKRSLLRYSQGDANDNVAAAQSTEFEVLAERVLDRRAFLGGGVAAFVMGSISPVGPALATNRLDFQAVAANTLDTVTVPRGYNWHVVTKWGEPMWSDVPDFNDVTRGTAASQAKAFGDNNDGMALFTQADRHVLAVNNEYANQSIIFGNRADGKPKTKDDVLKGKAAHGVSIVEVAQKNGRWSILKDSLLNRRITPDTRMDIIGPARGHALMKTDEDPTGSTTRGTWSNCGNGRTPWGTYLTCEENFNGYFTSSDTGFRRSREHKRYGVRIKGWGYGWASVDPRFDFAKNPNDPNRVGYVVEIDPFNPKSTPRKLTALGRFKHENAELVVADNGRVVVYMGDDERGEFLYKYISDAKYVAGGDNASLLETGKLFAAKFHDDGRGEWRELNPATTGMASQAVVCIYTRLAASNVGATTMDRPEWVAANPHKAEIYCALTNNKNRGRKTNRGGDEMPVGGPNPRAVNKYGQIVRWRPDDGNHTSAGFDWDLFVLAGNPTAHTGANRGSSNITADNMFNSPDGLAFDNMGLLWIQTDGKISNKGDFADMGNNQMLVGDPQTGEIRRFLVGPIGCEVTGSTWSADRRTMFVGIQHPGARGGSHFPDGGQSVPRSSVIAIRRDDGKVIG
jgi:uncharacterized protein